MKLKKNIRKLNQFFKYAGKKEFSYILDNIVLSERQETVFLLFYVKKYDINYIADTLNICPRVIGTELSIIRDKIYPLLN